MMFNKAAFLLAITLALPAVVTPAVSQPAARGTTIPLRKRSSLTRPDGVFDADKAVLVGIATRNKHRQNLINLKKNVGLSVFNKVRIIIRSTWVILPVIASKIKPLASVPKDVETRMMKHQSEALTDENDELWAGKISVGTPAQKFLIDFDSIRLIPSLVAILGVHQLHLLQQIEILHFCQEDWYIYYSCFGNYRGVL
ncbi:hypothetical protein B0H17DRAFT_1134762 [Mycena rosella]|uniref:RxLR effector protein n=1 Tax=Mycena rosella TaxID=1033263 RepID=A0AAD7DF44_MYCRO|nr:hypothetical protein B0H17DRAFT_1134762 [Mycena rosella]